MGYYLHGSTFTGALKHPASSHRDLRNVGLLLGVSPGLENQEALQDRWIYFLHLSCRLRDGAFSRGLFSWRSGDLRLGISGGASVWRGDDFGFCNGLCFTKK